MEIDTVLTKKAFYNITYVEMLRDKITHLVHDCFHFEYVSFLGTLSSH